MRFLIDGMLPPEVAHRLTAAGHDAITPAGAGAHNLPDSALIEIATMEGRVIVTENASDFAQGTSCPVLLVRKSWWPTEALVSRLSGAIHRWADANPEPGPWAHWMDDQFR